MIARMRTTYQTVGIMLLVAALNIRGIQCKLLLCRIDFICVVRTLHFYELESFICDLDIQEDPRNSEADAVHYIFSEQN